MKRFSQFVLASALVLSLAASAFAQGPTTVQQSAAKLDVATFLQSPLGGATACSTVNTTTANGTVTITPGPGQYVVITGVYIDITANATATTGVATMSTTNLTGSPFWSLATLAVATGGAAQFRQIAEEYPTGLKSTAPGTAVTFVPSAQIANSIVCTRVAGYFINP